MFLSFLMTDKSPGATRLAMRVQMSTSHIAGLIVFCHTPISGRWFNVFYDHELKQDNVEEDDTFDTWEIPFTQDDPQKATLEVLKAMSFVISYTLYACQGYVPRSPEPFVKSTKRTSATLVYIYVTFHMSTSSTNSFYCEWCTTTENWKCKKATDESFETLNNVEKLVHHMFLPLIQKKME
jgi:hypothetical protein